jgi:hypothetical protein
MNDVYRPPVEQGEDAILLPEELMILNRLRELAAAGKEEVDAETLVLIDQHIHWSLDDPESLKRSAYFMTQDPFLKREIDQINREFAQTEGDGLEGY